MTDLEVKAPTSDELRDELSLDVGISRIDITVKPRRFGEVMEEIAPQGTRVRLVDWLDTPIVVHSLRFFVTHDHKCAHIMFTDINGELFNALTSWRVVLPKLAAVANQLPLECTFVKREGGQKGVYYDVE